MVLVHKLTDLAQTALATRAEAVKQAKAKRDAIWETLTGDVEAIREQAAEKFAQQAKEVC